MPTIVLPSCTCARHADGSVTTFLCSAHADQDPCLTMAQTTGRRRKGTIRRGVCTSCGHRAAPPKLSDEVYEAAEAAYDREDQAWFNAQTTETLVAMWALCRDWTTAPSWDDEVFDALAARGHFDEAPAK